jgi:membrane dipeptidase
MTIVTGLCLSFLPSCNNGKKKPSDQELREMASAICRRNIILDSHIDWPEFIVDNPEDISGRTLKGDFDLERAREGGLNAALSVAYVNSGLDVEDGRIMVDSMLNLINHYPETYPDKIALAYTPGDIATNFDKGLFSLVPCLENGSPSGNDLDYFKYLKERGIVYVTLCHNRVNQISDSNFDPDRKWNGLSPYGIEVIGELNRLGIIADVSHSTDSTVFQALRFSRAPIVATHSSCRHFVPGFERNLSDTLIKAIARKKGVVMVNFGSMFLDSVCLRNTDKISDILKTKGISIYSQEGLDLFQKFSETNKVHSDSKKLVDHIDHIVQIAGIDYVGLGSDFDGIGPTQPSDIPDVSAYPVIVYELLKRGYTEDDIKKVLSGNFIRVWNEVISVADSLSGIPVK